MSKLKTGNEAWAKEQVGEENWDDFLRWMKGQTVAVADDGSIYYYDHDVEAFVEKLKTGYDRQEDPLRWD